MCGKCRNFVRGRVDLFDFFSLKFKGEFFCLGVIKAIKGSLYFWFIYKY